MSCSRGFLKLVTLKVVESSVLLFVTFNMLLMPLSDVFVAVTVVVT